MIKPLSDEDMRIEWYRWRCSVRTTNANLSIHHAPESFDAWLARKARALRILSAEAIEGRAFQLGLTNYLATTLRGHA